MSEELPHYGLVPKGLSDNLEYRDRLYDAAYGDVSLQRGLYSACADDPLFWINSFCWIFEPRTGEKLPFLTYDFQDDLIMKVVRRMGHGDIGILKSRCMGVSWCVMTILHWFWQFRRNFTAVVGSWKEKLVDSPGNPDTLFWKLDYLRSSQPSWMQPILSSADRTSLHLLNPETGSVIDGTSTTEDMTRAGRRMCVAFDEYGRYGVSHGYALEAASYSVTDTRIFFGTPTGAVGSFYEQMTMERRLERTILRIELPWTLHPDYRRGLYRSGDRGRLEVLDESYEFPPDYPFVLDGRTRSPWYDAQEDRFSNRMLISQEIDMNWLGASGQYFDPEIVKRNKFRDVSPCLHSGELDFDPDTFEPREFRRCPAGRLQLWLNPDSRGCVPSGKRYAIGVDISGGTGSSNSVAMVADIDTAEHVATFCISTIDPVGFSQAVVALARWFNDAYLIPEANGVPGTTFIGRCFSVGYENMYFRKKEDEVGRATTRKPGWYATPTTKGSILSELHRAITRQEFLVRDEYVFEEMKRYCYGPDGQPVHPSSLNKSDPSGAKHNHGDRVIACALTWEGIRDIASSPDKAKEVIVPPNSFQGRRLAYERRLREEREAGGWRCGYRERSSLAVR